MRADFGTREPAIPQCIAQ
uniref:Uncharacterized protein n=1 Tax=Anguilla anguilla TaxID=7936 RepID=A0A0E9TG35_ANGAN